MPQNINSEVVINELDKIMSSIVALVSGICVGVAVIFAIVAYMSPDPQQPHFVWSSAIMFLGAAQVFATVSYLIDPRDHVGRHTIRWKLCVIVWAFALILTFYIIVTMVGRPAGSTEGPRLVSVFATAFFALLCQYGWAIRKV